MEWWQILITAILVIIIMKMLDNFFSNKNDRRELKQKLILKDIEEIDDIFNTVSIYYELSLSYYPTQFKNEKLDEFYNDNKEFHLLGKCHKYPTLVQSVRDIIQLFKKIAFTNINGPLNKEEKEELQSKFVDIQELTKNL
ncbi:MAG: hypothetical protein ACI81I_000982, partial [Arcobacteraceae bacterium]